MSHASGLTTLKESCFVLYIYIYIIKFKINLIIFGSSLNVFIN